MKRILLLLLLTTALHAQTTATIFLSRASTAGDSAFAPEPGAQTHFDDGSGFGASLARSFGPLSAELALFRLSTPASIRANGTDVFSLGDIDVTPITAMLRYHFLRGRAWDVYAGAGAAYVRTGDIESDDTRAEGLEPIQVDNVTTAVFGGGIAYDFGNRLGVTLDARYLPLTLRGRPEADEDEIEADLDPLVLSAGLRIRF